MDKSAPWPPGCTSALQGSTYRTDTWSEAVYVVPEKMAELLHDYRLRQVVVSEEIDSIHFKNILSHLCVIYVPDATFV